MSVAETGIAKFWKELFIFYSSPLRFKLVDQFRNKLRPLKDLESSLELPSILFYHFALIGS